MELLQLYPRVLSGTPAQRLLSWVRRKRDSSSVASVCSSPRALLPMHLPVPPVFKAPHSRRARRAQPARRSPWLTADWRLLLLLTPFVPGRRWRPNSGGDASASPLSTPSWGVFGPPQLAGGSSLSSLSRARLEQAVAVLSAWALDRGLLLAQVSGSPDAMSELLILFVQALFD